MKIFVISDLHLGHANIIKMCNRPFRNIEEMDNKIIENWNKVVGKNDLVYVVGDFAFKGKNAEHYLDKLNGSVILIKGNHDKYIKHSKVKGIYDYKEIEVKGVKYVLSHYPMIAWSGQFRNSVHLYGHVHSSGKDWEFPKIPNAHSVCCEFHNYTPVEINKFKPKEFKDEIEKLMYSDKRCGNCSFFNKKEDSMYMDGICTYMNCLTNKNDWCTSYKYLEVNI